MIIRLLLLLSFFSASHLFSGIEAYFKKPLNKAGPHQMRNIDFIYTINLDQRPEKFEKCIAQLNPYGIYPYRFSAVNGWELSLDSINAVGVQYGPEMAYDLMGNYYPPDEEGQYYPELISVYGRTYFCLNLARGPIGIALSHLSILQDAYTSGYKTIWVMEDDIDVKHNPHLLSEMIDKLDALVGKNGWDILFTDQDTKNQKGEYVPCCTYARRPNFIPKNPARFAERTNISFDFRKIGTRYGAYSMIVRRSGMKKLLDFFKTYKIFLPYDMDYCLPDDIQLYCVRNDIVSTLVNAISDNGSPAYKDK